LFEGREAVRHGKQEGDPRKLALALVRIVNDGNPLRFLAGADAASAFEQVLEASKTDLARWRHQSISLAHEV